MPATVRLLGLPGSLRRASHSTAVLRTLAERCPPDVVIDLHDLRAVPLYDQDLDGEATPEPVRALKEAIAAADGLVIVSPEYNHGIPGVLKNALDWASRPAFRSPLVGKPVLIATASPAFTGGVRAQAQLRETLASTLSLVVPAPEIVIGGVHEKVRDGRLVDEAAVRFALDGLAVLAAEIRARRALAGGIAAAA